MTSHTIHIFNPETDYALATGRKEYSMPASIRRFRKEMELFPATFSRPGDFIAVDDVAASNGSDHRLSVLAEQRDVKVVGIRDIAGIIRDLGKDNVRIKPWGWNHTLRRTLIRAGVEENLLKTEDEIDTMRELSHRRTAILFQNSLSELLPDIGIIPASEFQTSDEALEFLDREGDAFFKMPWSSSGRGVIHASGFQREKLRQWLEGSVRRQGSVMGEHAFHKVMDFATEWIVEDGEAVFLGLSLFRTSEEGRYGGNEIIPQKEIDAIISSSTPEWGKPVIEAQRSVLENLCLGRYSGPVGIDMLSTEEGHLVPCVEINFRQTMGMAALNRCLINEAEQ